MKLHTYVNEILDIVNEANKTSSYSWSVGADMFLANVRNAGMDCLPYYPGAEHVDYLSLKPHYQQLAESMVAFVEAVQTRYDEVMDLRAKGEFKAIVDLISPAEQEI